MGGGAAQKVQRQGLYSLALETQPVGSDGAGGWVFWNLLFWEP